MLTELSIHSLTLASSLASSSTNTNPQFSTTHDTTIMMLSARQALRTAGRTFRVPVTAAARSVATNAKVSLVDNWSSARVGASHMRDILCASLTGPR